jgi:hypothetical protein
MKTAGTFSENHLNLGNASYPPDWPAYKINSAALIAAD